MLPLLTEDVKTKLAVGDVLVIQLYCSASPSDSASSSSSSSSSSTYYADPSSSQGGETYRQFFSACDVLNQLVGTKKPQEVVEAVRKEANVNRVYSTLMRWHAYHKILLDPKVVVASKYTEGRASLLATNKNIGRSNIINIYILSLTYT
jgi:hypothetical protein